MSDMLKRMGLKQEKGSFSQALFYFIREFKINPLDEVYIDASGSRLIKKGMSIPLFSALMNEMNEHYKREEAEMKRSRGR